MSHHYFTPSPVGAPSGKAKQRGLSLVELMISMTIGLFLIAAIASLFVGSKQAYRTGDNLSRLQENGRFAIDLLGRNIRVAGYTQISFAPTAFGSAVTPTTFSGQALYNSGVAGIKTGSDSITVSYDSPTDKDCLGATPPTVGTVLRATNAFWINSSNQLMCTSNGATGVVLDGVEDMQILYGVPVGLNTKYIAAPTAAEMTAATTVRLCVLLRTTSNNLATQAQTYTDCNGTSVPAPTGDRYIHRAFSATVNVRDRTP
jgi:type IV pilus assembly protein PilW